MASNDEDYEKMTKILFIDFDNSVLEFITPEQEEELKIWKDIVKTEDYWSQLIRCYLNDKECKNYFDPLPFDRKKAFFMFGVACIISFVQANFTGPELSEGLMEYLTAGMFTSTDFSSYLKLNNQKINPCTKFPCLLTAAKLIFKNCHFNPLVNVWWGWRSIIIHQLIMDELNSTLLYEAQKLEKETPDLKLEGHVKAKFAIEQAQLMLLYRQVQKAEEYIDEACDILGLKYEYNLSTNPVSLEVTLIERSNIQRPPVHLFPVPQNNYPSDQPVLNPQSPGNDRDNKLFPNTEQKLLLAIIHLICVSSPPHLLEYTEAKAFFEIILSQNNTWTVRTAALLLRHSIEENLKYDVNRAIVQLQEILECYKKDRPHRLTRIGGVYGTCLQPIWRTEKMYANSLLNAGCAKDALEIFTRCGDYTNVLKCFNAMKKDKKFQANFLKKRFQATKDERILCYLGDLTTDCNFYENAWTLSRTRCFQAQRQWALYLFDEKRYQEAVPHFEKSLSINPLQPELWVKMGIAALACEQYQTAATALRRHTALEPKSIESWRNLAQAYMKIGNKTGAHHALLQCLKITNNNWKTWEKLLLVSADISHFGDIIRAYHVLLNLKKNYLNTEVLGALVYGVTHNINDMEGKPSSQYTQQARSLLGRIVTIYPDEGLVWELYAGLAPLLVLKGLRYERAYHAYTQEERWPENVISCQHVLHVCHKLGEIVLNPDIDPRDEIVTSVRLMISTSIGTVMKMEHSETRKILSEVSCVLGRIIEKAKSCSSKVK